LAPETTRDSVFEAAEVVEELARNHPVSLEIKTHVTWLTAERARYKKFKHVSLDNADLDPETYRKWLAEADILLLAYNFDPETAAYLRFSFANKLPEYLASDAPVLAYGPSDIGTMRFLRDRNAALIVSERGSGKLREGIERLIIGRELRAELSNAASAVAFSDLDLDAQRERFRADLSAAAAAPAARHWRAPDVTNFPLSREDGAQLDECRVAFEVLREIPAGIMLDIGAHIGGSLKPFAEAGWTVHAFEPDPQNRSKLLEGFGSRQNVIISDEAVSGTAGEEVPFYASDESTGISGLSAFRDTHREVARVKTVTLDDVVARRGLSRIDFLKIDIEGWELPALRAFDFGRVAPAAVLVEYENDKTEAHGYDAHDLAQFLVDRGYTVYVSEWHPIERYGVRHSFRRLQKYPCEIPASSWGNLIGFRTDPAPALLKRAIRAAVDRPILFEGEDEPEPVRAPVAVASGEARNATKGPPLPPLSARFGGGKAEAPPASRAAPAAEPAMSTFPEPAKVLPSALPRRRRWRRPDLSDLLRPARRSPVLSTSLAVGVLGAAVAIAAWPFMPAVARPEILFALLAANVALTVLFARLQRKMLISRLNDLFRRTEEAGNAADLTTRGSLRRRMDEVLDATLKELREQSKAAAGLQNVLLTELREQTKATAELRKELAASRKEFAEAKEQLAAMQASQSARQEALPAAPSEPPRSGGRRRRRRPSNKG
jgi:FkbM family methyltransferase